MRKITKTEYKELSKTKRYKNRLVRTKHGFYFIE